MKRKLEFILGLIGGILGLLMALYFELVLFFLLRIHLLLLFSIVGLVGAILVRKKEYNKLPGYLMVIGGVGGFIAAYAFFYIPAALLVIAGLLIIFEKLRFFSYTWIIGIILIVFSIFLIWENNIFGEITSGIGIIIFIIGIGLGATKISKLKVKRKK